MPKLTEQIIVALLCAGILALAIFMRPNILMSEQRKVELNTIVPTQFADWREEKSQSSVVNPPELDAFVNKLYSQVLQRTYVNSAGVRIMLSIAYSPDQRDNNGRQVHKPEICYPAQGFTILEGKVIDLQTNYGNVPAKYLLAKLDARIEPMIYWTTMGDDIVRGGQDLKLTQFKYGLRKIVADGIIFRVSSINSDAELARQHQIQFVNDLLASATPAGRSILGLN